MIYGGIGLYNYGSPKKRIHNFNEPYTGDDLIEKYEAQCKMDNLEYVKIKLPNGEMIVRYDRLSKRDQTRLFSKIIPKEKSKKRSKK